MRDVTDNPFDPSGSPPDPENPSGRDPLLDDEFGKEAIPFANIDDDPADDNNVADDAGDNPAADSPAGRDPLLDDEFGKEAVPFADIDDSDDDSNYTADGIADNSVADNSVADDSAADSSADVLNAPAKAAADPRREELNRRAASRFREKVRREQEELQAAAADQLADADPDTEMAVEAIFHERERDLADRLRTLPIWLLSIGLHVLIMIFLGMHVFGTKHSDRLEIIAQPSDEVGVDMDDLDADDLDIADFSIDTFEEPTVETPIATSVDIQPMEDVPLTDDLTFDTEQAAELVEPVSAASSLTGLAGRMEGKARLLKSGGGNDASEKAVQNALVWLARHQRPDGSWSIQHDEGLTCQCGGGGSRPKAPMAATSLALLPFLGAGNTPTHGKYADLVAKGIDFLLANGQRTPQGFDMRDEGGTMYSHGLATIALCEACAMARDDEKKKYSQLRQAAKEAVAFIVFAQDPNEGGWRYQPQQPGDTSVVGWQLMALKSAEYGGINVPPEVMAKARAFLAGKVAYDGGTRYGYTDPGTGTDATTAIGLLCRLFLDWGVDNRVLAKGTDAIIAEVPKYDNPYLIYYATQLFHHIGGPKWTTWNNQVRDELIRRQATDGERAGSWDLPVSTSISDSGIGYSSAGGRLYVTSLYCMTLEVYYRHMPIYQLRKAGRGSDLFPID